MRRAASSFFAVLFAFTPNAALAQVIRTRVSGNPVGPAAGLPVNSPLPLLNSGLSLGSPSLSLSFPLSPAPSVVLSPVSAVSVAPKANLEAVKAVAVKPVATASLSVSVAVRLPILGAVKAPKAQPPQAAPSMDPPSASVLFDGISVRSSASVGDPVFPGDDSLTPARKPLSRVHPILPGAHAPLHVDADPSPSHDGHHHGHDHAHPEGGAHESALKRAMAAASFFIAIEMLGGYLTGNAALIADSLHLAADQVIIGAALFSSWLSRRPASPSRPHGFRKAEAVVGLLAAALIGFTGVHMGVEAWERFLEPAAAATWSVALFALASLGANLSSALILRRHHGKSLGVKGAFMVAITDTVGSVGVIVSAAASILFGWAWMEPLVVALIGLMIVRIAWGLAKPAWVALRAPPPAPGR